MNSKLKNNLILVAFGVILFAAVMNIGTVWSFAKAVMRLGLPLMVGFVLAFVLNVPMSAFERLFERIFSNRKNAPKLRLRRLISLLLTLICVILVVVLLCTLIIPELLSSGRDLYKEVLESWPGWMAALDQLFIEYNIHADWFYEWLSNVNIQNIVGNLLSGTGNVISSAVSIFSSAMGVLINISIGIVLSIYVLLSKDGLARGATRLMRASLKDSVTDYVIHVARLINGTYSKFLSGQCMEACILGSLIFIAFSIAGIPYASITGVLTAVCAFVPYVGAFMSCFIGAVLVLLAEPGKLILCIVLYMAVQFVENQFIYPHVVGTSVGMGSMWTLMAVIIGGKLLGLLGMIFFIPLLAVIISLVREWVDLALKKKGKEETSPEPPPEET